MNPETIFTNAVLVLPDEVLAGTLVMRGDTIAEVARGGSSAQGAIDLDGDYLIPGVVDVHTDNLERQVLPRSLAPVSYTHLDVYKRQDEVITDDRGGRMFVCSDTDHCERRREAA